LSFTFYYQNKNQQTYPLLLHPRTTAISLSSANGIQTNMGSTSTSITNSIFTSGTATVYPIIGTPNSLSGAVAINPNGTPNLSAFQQLPILAYFIYLNNITTNAAVHLVPVYSGNTCTGFNVAASGVE